MDLKKLLKMAIDENVPEIIRLQASIAEIEVGKALLRERIDELNIENELLKEQLTPREESLLGLMTEHNAARVITKLYAVKRCRDTNPTVEVIDLRAVPKRYIVEKPQADKRLIQTEFVNNKIIPPGVKVEYGQYLKIIERKVKEDV